MAILRKVFKIPKAVKALLLGVSLLLSFDVVLVVLGASYLGETISFFSGKSAKTVLSDLLFLEGAAIFGFSALVTYTILTKRDSDYESDADGKGTTDERRPQKRIPVWVLILIIGACLIGLSVAISLLHF